MMFKNERNRHFKLVAMSLLQRTAPLLLTTAAAVFAAPVVAQPHEHARWAATWTASPQPLWGGDFALTTNLPPSLWNQTVREIARLSVGGRRLRVVLSNEYGSVPLVIGDARVALAGEGATVVTGSGHTLTFSGNSAITIPPGASAISDPVDLAVAALGSVSVSLYLPNPTSPSTFHWDARQTTYVGSGNQVAAVAMKSFSTLTTRVFLSSILTEGSPLTRAVAAFGDSITDGAGSTMDANARWPDFLAERLADHNITVLNAGISGARVLRDKMGVNALARFQRDVLDQPGIEAVIVLIGINDISWNNMVFAPEDAPVTADEIIAGYRQLIASARVHNVRIIGATLTPFEGALQNSPMTGFYSVNKERVRQAVNHWIRESGEFDAVVDFDAVTRDPAHPARFLPAYDSGDHLHPGDAGDKAMAAAIDLHALVGHR